MKQRFIFGIDVTPRKQTDYFASERDAYHAKYKALAESTPARDKNGKFAKRKK